MISASDRLEFHFICLTDIALSCRFQFSFFFGSLRRSADHDGRPKSRFSSANRALLIIRKRWYSLATNAFQTHTRTEFMARSQADGWQSATCTKVIYFADSAFWPRKSVANRSVIRISQIHTHFRRWTHKLSAFPHTKIWKGGKRGKELRGTQGNPTPFSFQIKSLTRWKFRNRICPLTNASNGSRMDLAVILTKIAVSLPPAFRDLLFCFGFGFCFGSFLHLVFVFFCFYFSSSPIWSKLVFGG